MALERASQLEEELTTANHEVSLWNCVTSECQLLFTIGFKLRKYLRCI